MKRAKNAEKNAGGTATTAEDRKKQQAANAAHTCNVCMQAFPSTVRQPELEQHLEDVQSRSDVLLSEKKNLEEERATLQGSLDSATDQATSFGKQLSDFQSQAHELAEEKKKVEEIVSSCNPLAGCTLILARAS